MNVARKRKIIILIICCCTFLYMTITLLRLEMKENKELNKYTEDGIEKGKEKVLESISNIIVTINGITYQATLEDNRSAQEFAKRLPLVVTMTDLNNNEKYYYFDEPMASSSKKVGKIEKGDIMLYGNDCLVLFYDTFETPYSYTKIAKLINADNLEEVVGSETVEITFSLE